MYFQFANVLVFFVLSIVLVGGMLLLASLLRPNNPEALKLSTYECGEPPTGGAWINFNIRFYIIALVFLIFEVEVRMNGRSGLPAARQAARMFFSGAGRSTRWCTA